MARDKKQLPRVRGCRSPSLLHDKGVLSMLSDKSGETKSISRAMLCSAASDCGQLKENLMWILKRGEGEIRMKEKQWTPSTKGELVEGLDKELLGLNACVHVRVCESVCFYENSFFPWTNNWLPPTLFTRVFMWELQKKNTNIFSLQDVCTGEEVGWEFNAAAADKMSNPGVWKMTNLPSRCIVFHPENAVDCVVNRACRWNSVTCIVL